MSERSDYLRQYRRRLVAEHRCSTCGRPKDDLGYRTCSDCRAYRTPRRSRATSRPSVTIPLKAAVEQRVDAQPDDIERPRTRADCVDGPRPCPWYGCKFHLGLEVKGNGSLVLRELTAESCALDVADRGEHTLDQVGEMLGLTRERIRQVEIVALLGLKRRCEREP